ncbi:L-2-amino-thiazoline-4-carboxylic acid hydrolase [Clostridium aceticum]|uniref:L-2-amino-thiazoline-4-carboxylic acid hydrolase n=1 Tax=Clostridium aceticum TaxID=84022 RepID=A0A0D8I9X1_9CLOT|nr:L-2-amino-thiazoline-4-carboxylic acid hydrolase [Clostridium aceticum]AKL95950.1 L-2-amino-thiazoline-4-carboxylic acid hydrolase [Clostridium aceticum]KJF27100.1 hypothetical protein TZ02_09900 [Clostridium aceticum]
MSVNQKGDHRKEVVCGIEHHATLFALLAKYAILSAGEEGEKVMVDAITQYGRERGQRMAKNALANGDELNLVNSQAYGEWRPKEGEMENSILRSEDSLVTLATKCAWKDAWEKHNLLEYGKYYCVTIDEAVFNGFRDDFHVDVIKNISWGADCCEFDWKIPMTQEEIKQVQEKKAQLGNSCVKDFNFHTAHLLHTVGNTMKARLGQEGVKAIEAAIEDYVKLFGKEYLDAIQNRYPEK